MGRKSDAAVVTRLINQHGDLKGSEYLSQLRSPRIGRKRRWDVHELKELYLAVEAIRGRGLPVMEACRQYQRFSRRSQSVVESRYFEARRRFDDPIRPVLQELLPSFLEKRPPLAKFVEKITGTSETPAILALIRKHRVSQ